MLRSAYYLFLSGLTRLLGFRGSEPLTALMSSARFRANGSRNLAYLGHLARIFPDSSHAWRESILKRYWRVHQRAFLGLFHAGRLSPEILPERVEWENRELLDEALAEGRGVMLLSPHFGDERTLHILLAMSGYPMHVISSRYPGASKTVRKARLRVSMKWHHVGFPDQSPRWIYDSLKANEIVQTSPTAWGGPHGHWVMSFGVPVLASSTPVRIASSTGCRLLVACNHALPGVRYRIALRRFDPLSLDRSGTAELFEIFEGMGRAFPDQYNWMNLVIRHRETNTIARLGAIPVSEGDVEAATQPEDWDPENIRDYSGVSLLAGVSK